MDHPEGASLQRADRVVFDPRVRLEFRGAKLISDSGLLVMREMDNALELTDPATALKNTAAETEHGHLAARPALFRQPARLQTPLRRKTLVQWAKSGDLDVRG